MPHECNIYFMRVPKATIVNMLTVTTGSLIGLWFRQYFSSGVEDMVFQAVGLGTIVIGIKMALRVPEGYLLIFMFSLIFGSVAGQLMHLDQGLEALSSLLKEGIGNTDSSFTEGLITAFLLFCIGSMTIVGALEEGLYGKRELLYVKATLDGFSSIMLASTYGIGVLFSIIPMLIFQGGITLMSSRLKAFFSEKVLNSLSGVGGVLIIGISFNLLRAAKINLENMLPSLLVVCVLAYGYEKRKNKFE